MPTTAQSVTFCGLGEFLVFSGGVQRSVTAVGSTTGGTIHGADITVFPGQLGELRFQGGGRLDNIFFSTEPIPEPSIAALLGLGILSLAWRFRRHRRPVLTARVLRTIRDCC